MKLGYIIDGKYPMWHSYEHDYGMCDQRKARDYVLEQDRIMLAWWNINRMWI